MVLAGAEPLVELAEQVGAAGEMWISGGDIPDAVFITAVRTINQCSADGRRSVARCRQCRPGWRIRPSWIHVRCWQAASPRFGSTPRRVPFQAAILGQDRCLELTELAAGIDTELLGKGLSHPPKGGERFGLPAGAEQAGHELCTQFLVHRMARYQHL